MRFIFLIDRYAARANQFAANLLSALPPKADMQASRQDVAQLSAQISGVAACPVSASLVRSAACPSNMNSVFFSGVRAALHMIDEGSQFRHDLPVARIIKKYAGHHRRKRLEHPDEFS